MNENRQNNAAGRVVITGIGMVTPLGAGKEDFGRSLFSGDTGIAEIKSFDTSKLSSHLGAEVTNFSARDFISVKNLRRMDKTSIFATAAARLALQDAGITITEENRDRIGMILGTAFGATDVTAQFSGTLMTQGPASVNPIMVPNIVMNAPAGHASIELGFRGVNTTVTQYAVSAETAIAYAADEIRRGRADLILAGGVDILSPFYYESLTRFRSLSPQNSGAESCRPFDKERNGTVAGEGSGIILLETMESAVARGRKPYCEIKGVGMSSWPSKPTAWPESPEGIQLAFKRALQNAGVSMHDVQIVLAAANGDSILDAAEAQAYASLLEPLEQNPFVTSIKGALGESFSGGGIRACALTLCLQENVLPPTLGLDKPVLPLSFVTGNKKEAIVTNAVLSGISFGGTCCYLVFGANTGNGD